jgi:HK97 family phage prohead protease
MSIETRTTAEFVEVRTDENNQRTAIGYAAKFDSLSANLGGFVEVIRNNAFTQTLESGTGQDARALWNHDSSQVLGRVSAGTLRLSEDETGLRFEIDLPNTTTGRDASELLQRGDVQGASFGFRVVDDAWGETETGFPLRELRSVALSEVSLVAFPAYPETEVALRSLAQQHDLDFEQVRAAAADDDLKSLITADEDDTDEPSEPHSKVPRSAGFR